MSLNVMECQLLLTPFGQTRNVLTSYISTATSVSGGGTCRSRDSCLIFLHHLTVSVCNIPPVCDRKIQDYKWCNYPRTTQILPKSYFFQNFRRFCGTSVIGIMFNPKEKSINSPAPISVKLRNSEQIMCRILWNLTEFCRILRNFNLRFSITFIIHSLYLYKLHNH